MVQFSKLQEDIEDYEDLRILRKFKEIEKDLPTIGMKELKKRLEKKNNR